MRPIFFNILAIIFSIQIHTVECDDDYIADVFINIVSVSSSYNMSSLIGIPQPCPKNLSATWPSMNGQLVVFSSSSWCPSTGYSTSGLAPNVNFGGGLATRCPSADDENIFFHVSLFATLTCDGNTVAPYPVCIDTQPIKLNTSQGGTSLSQSICQDSLSIVYSYVITCRNPNSSPPDCAPVCSSYQNDTICYNCHLNGTKYCCDGFGGSDCVAGGSSLSTVTISTSTVYCPDNCYNIQPNNLEQTYKVSMIVCAVVALMLLIMVIILCVVCANHKSVIKSLRDYQNEARLVQRESEQYQPRSERTNGRTKNNSREDERERPSYYR